MIRFLFKIWGLARPYRVRLWLGLFTGILAGLAQPAMIACIKLVYGTIFPTAAATSVVPGLTPPKHLPGFATRWLDSIQHWLAGLQDEVTRGLHAHPMSVLFLIGLIPLVVLLRGVVSYLNIYFLQWVAIRAITDLRVRLFNHVMGLSAGFFNKATSGDLISRIINDTNSLQNVISGATSVIVKDPATLVFTFALLLYENAGLTLMALVVLPLCIIPIAIFGRKVRRSAGNIQNQLSELTGLMSESFTGNRIIKAYNLEDTVVAEFRDTSKKLIGNYMRIVRSMETPGPLTEFFGSIGASLVIFYIYQAHHGAANGADFLELVLGLFIMYSPIKNLARLHNTLEQAKAASQRVFELLATENTIPEPANPKPLKAAGAEINFQNVFFNFDTKEILKAINLTVKPGQLVALVGESGSGKTTISNLLLRFYDPLKGSVQIGGIDLREVSTLDLRKQMAVVTQETILFNDTIRNNIALGRPGATNEEIEAAAKHAHAHDFILEKEGGYDAVIGEKGVMLSGGQRQRLAIARAILKDAPILILDEATSALDSQAERIVQDALDELMRGRTTICIAHRLSTIQKADLIVVLDHGRIVEMGQHEELLARDSRYRKMYQLQSGG
jgi:subfamily B ATP-binding cassette protein MsbA